MATIQINEDWQIDSNALCWSVREKGSYDKKAKKWLWIPRTFHGSLEAAVKAYKKRTLRLSDATTVKGLIEAANIINKEVEMAFKEEK